MIQHAGRSFLAAASSEYVTELTILPCVVLLLHLVSIGKMQALVLKGEGVGNL